MADHSGNFGINQFLRNRGTDFRVGLIVFGHEFDAQYFAVNLDFLGIGLIDREAHAILVVLAQMRDRTGQRPRVGDGHDNGWLGRCSRFSGRRRLFFATTNDTGSDHGREQDFIGRFHRCISREGGENSGTGERDVT